MSPAESFIGVDLLEQQAAPLGFTFGLMFELGDRGCRLGEWSGGSIGTGSSSAVRAAIVGPRRRSPA